MNRFLIDGDKNTRLENIQQAEQHLQPGKDLAVMDDQTGNVCMYYRWYPFTKATENFRYLPKGTAEKAIVSPDDTGIWLKDIPMSHEDTLSD